MQAHASGRQSYMRTHTVLRLTQHTNIGTYCVTNLHFFTNIDVHINTCAVTPRRRSLMKNMRDISRYLNHTFYHLSGPHHTGEMHYSHFSQHATLRRGTQQDAAICINHTMRRSIQPAERVTHFRGNYCTHQRAPDSPADSTRDW
jgi:hypothetical protein